MGFVKGQYVNYFLSTRLSYLIEHYGGLLLPIQMFEHNDFLLIKNQFDTEPVEFNKIKYIKIKSKKEGIIK